MARATPLVADDWSIGDPEIRGSHLFLTGPGGGGRRFAELLLGPSTTDPLVIEETETSVTYRNSRGVVIDNASRRGLLGRGSSGTRLGVLAAAVDSTDSAPRIHELRRTAEGAAVMRRLAEWCGVPGHLADQLVAAASPATAIFDGFDSDHDALLTDADGFVRGTPVFQSGLRDLLIQRDDVLLDLLRVAALLDPSPFHVGDEWAAVSASVTGRVATTSDVNRAIGMFPDLWLHDSQLGEVRTASSFVAKLLTGLVPPSTSEYYGLYRYFSARARDMLFRHDVGDDFVSNQLPRTAVQAGAIDEFLADGPALLVSNVDAIVAEFERTAVDMVRPAAKAVLLSAHYRQATGQPGPSQTELALRRLALDSQANEIAELLPDRAWIPVWATSEPVNVHRVLVDRGSSVLALATAVREGEHGVVSGHSDGTLTWTGFDGHGGTLNTDSNNQAELRAIAAGSVNDRWLVGTAGSDNAVRVFDVEDGSLVWEDVASHTQPLSACATGHDSSGRLLLLTAGVGGELHFNDAETGAVAMPPIIHDAEYRGLAVANLDGVILAAYCAVDGVVGIIDLTSGTEKVAVNVGEGCNTLAVSVLGSSLSIVAGTSNGKLFLLSLQPDWVLTLEDITPAGIPAAEINAVVISHSLTGTRIEAARSDGVILVLSRDGSAPRPLSAHVGPVNALLPVPASVFGGEDELILVSGGGDGSVRLWRHVTTRVEPLTKQRINRHRGPVSRVLLLPAAEGDVQIVTGGYDGFVRAWAKSTGDRSTVEATADGKITSIVDIGQDGSRRLLIGADDGSIREVNLDAPVDEPPLLGMPHEGVTAMVGSVQDQAFWSGGRDGQINRWDLRTRTSEIHTDECSVGGVTSLALLDAGLVVGGQDGTLTLLDRRDLSFINRVSLGGGIRALATVPGVRDSLVVANARGELIVTGVFGPGAGEERRWTNAHDGEIASVVVFQLAGQRFIASAGRDRKLHIWNWNYASGTPLQTIDLEGLPTSLSVHVPYLSVSTTSGVAVFALGKNQDAPGT